MVTRVSGRANGTEISFEQKGRDGWEAAVPGNLEGKYTVELYAQDDAGNQTYVCTTLFIISGHEVQGYVVPRGFSVEAGAKDYTGFPTVSEFLGDILQRGFLQKIQEAGFASAVEKGGYTIERAICCRDND